MARLASFRQPRAPIQPQVPHLGQVPQLRRQLRQPRARTHPAAGPARWSGSPTVIAVGCPDSSLLLVASLLHKLGAREIMVFGLGPIGCIPLLRVLNDLGECQARTNNLALSFNQAASKMVQSLVMRLPNATIKFADAYDAVMAIINDPVKYGFSNSDSPCCSFGKIRPALTCIPASSLCSDRSKYVFWDEYHPTDSANELIAKELMTKFGFI